MSEYAVMPMTDYEGICNAVRAKTGGTAKLKSSEVKQEIEGIQTGSDPVVQPLTVTENGTYSAPEGVDGYNPVTVNVAGSGGDDGSLKAVIERTAADITLPSDLTNIGECAFYRCSNLALTALPEGVEIIWDQAFRDCTNLALTSLPEGLIQVSKYAFYGCSNLALTALPENIKYINKNCFASCTNLRELTIKTKPTIFASTAFTNCTNLLTINVPWAEGEVSGAPWGATNATINYNYTGG